jgi:hypothetical protein
MIAPSPIALTRPPWSSMTWRTPARPMPVPGNWLAGWSRWKNGEQLAGLGGVEAGVVVADVAAGAGVSVRPGPPHSRQHKAAGRSLPAGQLSTDSDDGYLTFHLK